MLDACYELVLAVFRPITATGKSILDILRRMDFGPNRRVELYRQLALASKANIATRESFASVRDIYQEFKKPPFTNKIAAWLNLGDSRHPMVEVTDEVVIALGSGMRLVDALKDWVPADEVALLSVGEASGKLPVAYERAQKLVKDKIDMWVTAVLGLSIPFLLYVCFVAGCYASALYVVPMWEQLSDPAHWDFSVRASVWLSMFHYQYISYLIVGSIFMMSVFVWAIPNWTADLRVYFDRHFPFSLLRMRDGAIFLMTFALLQQSRMPITQALDVLRQAANPYLKQRIEAISYGIRSGSNFGKACYDAGYGFPDEELIPMLMNMSDHKGFADSLLEFSDGYIDHTKKRMMRLIALFGLSSLFVFAILITIFSLAFIEVFNHIK